MNDVMDQSEVDNMLGKLTAFADHIRNALINASQLAQTVNELQEKVSALQSAVAITEQANRTLNETVQSLTEQRNAVVEERNHWRNEHSSATATLSQLQNEHSALQYSYESLQHTANDYRDQWNEANLEIQRLTNENAILAERLKRTQRYIDNMKATLAGEQTRDENGHFEELPKVAGGGW